MTEVRTMEVVVAELRAKRDVVEMIEAELRSAKQSLAESEEELMAMMHDQGVSQVVTQGLTLQITHSIVPQIKDWPAFIKYVQRHGAFHLVERRIHTTAWREELAERLNTPIPGIEPFDRIRLSVRSKD